MRGMTYRGMDELKRRSVPLSSKLSDRSTIPIHNSSKYVYRALNTLS